MRRAAWVAAAVVAAVVLVVVLVARRGGRGDSGVDRSAPGDRPAAPSRVGPAPVPAGQAPVPAVIDDSVIAQVLDEELVAVTSGIRIAELAVDEPHPCAGRPVWLRARTEGDAGDGRLVSRWIWATGSRLSMQPGASVSFTAPGAGTYPIRFQLVRALGGKRIGVLAERTLALPVVDCGSGPAPLRVESTVAGGRVDFTVLAGVSTRGGFTWDFGDGQTHTTDGPTVRHDYPILELGAEEVRAYQVAVEVATADGASLRATTGVTLRGQASPPLPPAIAAELGDAVWDEDARRWQRRIEVDNRARPAIVWERGERHSLHDDDRITTRTLTVAELLTIAEAREAGGFVATVTVTAAETTPGVRRITDRLHGRDASGEDATLTWVAWDRDDFVPDPAVPAASRR
jgi:hypothetical protein